jgi:glycosyltransferase involved in cell wall biosynthesis
LDPRGFGLIESSAKTLARLLLRSAAGNAALDTWWEPSARRRERGLVIMSPLVSIITPTFNQAAYLRETIESVLRQDYPDVQYLVINDGSTDETQSILESFGTRLRWWSRPNVGQTATINEGFRACGGEIVSWLNSDDTLLPGAVSWAVSAFARHAEAGVIFGDTQFTTSEGSPLTRSTAQPFDYETFVVECRNPIPQCSSFIRRSLLEEAGPLDTAFYYFMDWDLWLRAGLRRPIVYEAVLLSKYRLHSQSKTVAQARRSAPELEYMYRKYFGGELVPRSILRRQREATANMYFTSAGYFLRGGDTTAARRMAWRAVASDPLGTLRIRQLRRFVYCLLGGGRRRARTL